MNFPLQLIHRTPTPELVKLLENALEHYKANPTRTFNALAAACSAVAAKNLIERDGIAEVQKRSAGIQQADELFERLNNIN